jgi:hypothetical protein
MLYTLVLLICLSDAPVRCELLEERVENLGIHPGRAFLQAQALVAQWEQAHPGYVVRRWHMLPGRGA